MVSRGVLLINLGSPSEPTPRAVRRYLNEFLNDPFVVDLPSPLRQLLVYGVITPARAKNSAHAYAKIWNRLGSPLVAHTREFAEQVAARLHGKYEVRWAMRYGQPSIKEVAHRWKTDELIVVPLYPQYAESSTRTAIEAVKRDLPIGRDLRIIEDFYAEPEFIDSEAHIIGEFLNEYKADHLLLSFHGLPQHHLTKLHPQHCMRDVDCCEMVDRHNRYCYRAQCVATFKALRAKLDFPPEKVTFSFQSRLGRRLWIKPYTDHVVEELVKKGVKRLAVSCPSFVADCLETLEEVQMRLKDQFIAAGGEELKLIPALNAHPVWVEKFSALIERIQAQS